MNKKQIRVGDTVRYKPTGSLLVVKEIWADSAFGDFDLAGGRMKQARASMSFHGDSGHYSYSDDIEQVEEAVPQVPGGQLMNCGCSVILVQKGMGHRNDCLEPKKGERHRVLPCDGKFILAWDGRCPTCKSGYRCGPDEEITEAEIPVLVAPREPAVPEPLPVYSITMDGKSFPRGNTMRDKINEIIAYLHKRQ